MIATAVKEQLLLTGVNALGTEFRRHNDWKPAAEDNDTQVFGTCFRSPRKLQRRGDDKRTTARAPRDWYAAQATHDHTRSPLFTQFTV